MLEFRRLAASVDLFYADPLNGGQHGARPKDDCQWLIELPLIYLPNFVKRWRGGTRVARVQLQLGPWQHNQLANFLSNGARHARGTQQSEILLTPR